MVIKMATVMMENETLEESAPAKNEVIVGESEISDTCGRRRAMIKIHLVESKEYDGSTEGSLIIMPREENIKIRTAEFIIKNKELFDKLAEL